MSDLQISDLFGSYPKQDDPYLVSLLSRKSEIRDARSLPKDVMPKKGEGFPHQVGAGILISQYDRFLFADPPGTGKSWIIINTAEIFKTEYLKDPSDPTKITQVLILVSGGTAEDNIMQQIYKICGDYASKADIQKWYNIMTYQSFVNEITSEKHTDAEIHKFMSDKAIFVDEAHGLVSSDVAKRNDPDASEDKLSLNKMYDHFFKALHMGVNNKVILLTATPAINDVSEYPLIFNLILDLDKQMPRWKLPDWFDGTVTFDKFELLLRGKIAYTRELDTGAIAIPMGNVITGTNIVTRQDYKTHVMAVSMSEFQYNGYMSTKENSLGNTKRQASNFVFPNGMIKKGFHVYIKKLANGWYRTRSTNELREINVEGPSLREIFRDKESDEDENSPTALVRYSAKYFTVVTYIINASIFTYFDDDDGLNVYNREDVEVLDDDDNPVPSYQKYDNFGTSFVYIGDFGKGCGAILFAMLLEARGYTRLDIPNKSNLKIDDMTKRRRYVILTHKTTATQNGAAISAIVNDPRNMYGEYVEVVIGTRVAGEGISVYNGKQFFYVVA